MDSHDDDRPVGRILSRREVLKLLGVAGATALVGGSYQALRAAQTGGAYLPLVMRAGEVPTSTPTVTATGKPSSTATGISTQTATATGTPTQTATATGTPTQTATATGTPTQTAAATGTPTQTAAATGTPTQTATVTGTPTQTAAATGTPTSTATLTELPSSTATPTGTPTSVPSCVVRPEQTEGPFFLDVLLNRSDIREDLTTGEIEEGALLELVFHVSRIQKSSCTRFENVQVDVWHCDAFGNYSGVQGDTGNSLRGYQLTNTAGLAQFLTIYPGWYSGRTVHIHFKLRVMVDGQGYEFTSQLYFDDTLTDQVFLSKPYSTRGERDTRNKNDGIYQNGGSQLLLTVKPTKQGYRATFEIGLQV